MKGVRVKSQPSTSDKCPPHHWMIDSSNYGRCKYCPAERDFAVLLESVDLADEFGTVYTSSRYIEKARAGGRKGGSHSKKVKGRGR